MSAAQIDTVDTVVQSTIAIACHSSTHAREPNEGDAVVWSTRELADLAGTTVNTVRHYHSIGLLDEPERHRNGYKQYRTSHLASLIRLRRLVELGMPLARIADLSADAPTALGELDAELRAGIRRLHRARHDVAALLDARAPADAPRGFERVASQLSDADRSLVHICTRLLDAVDLRGLADRIGREADALRAEFSALPADARPDQRDRLAEAIARAGANWRSIDGPGDTGAVLSDARRELYHPAQHDVI